MDVEEVILCQLSKLQKFKSDAGDSASRRAVLIPLGFWHEASDLAAETLPRVYSMLRYGNKINTSVCLDVRRIWRF